MATREILLIISAVVFLLLIAASGWLSLNRSKPRADRAFRVLRLLLVVLTGAAITAAVRLHEVGLL